MRQKEEKPAKGSDRWFYGGLASASVAMTEDLPPIAKPFVRILTLLILSILTVLMTPWLVFRRFFPAKYTENPFIKARTELKTCSFSEKIKGGPF